MNQPGPQYGQQPAAPHWQPPNEPQQQPAQAQPQPQPQPQPQWGAPPPYPAHPVNQYDPKQRAQAAQGYQQPYAAPVAPQQPVPGMPNQGWQQAPAAHPAAPQEYQGPGAARPGWQNPGSGAPNPGWQQSAAPNPAWQPPAAAPSPTAAPPQPYQQPPAPAWPQQQPQQPAAYSPSPAPAPAPPQPWQQQPYPPASQYPAPASASAYQQQPAPYQAPPAPAPAAPHAYLPQPPAQPVSFPPPPGLSTPRDRLVEGATPFLEPGESVYYGFILKLDDTIPETPRELMIAIEGQHRVLGGISRADKKMNKGLKWALNPLDAMNERIAEKGTEALNRKLAGPVFVGGWESQAGWFIRYARATAEDYGPGAWGVLTDRRYLIFRAGRAGGSAMRLVHGVPRTLIAGVRTEGTKDAALHGRTPRAELHFTDGSMVATMMPTKQGQQVAAILAVQQQQPPQRRY